MITAHYKRKKISGWNWFLFGDTHWLLLTKKSTKETGKEAVSIDDLRKISKYPL